MVSQRLAHHMAIKGDGNVNALVRTALELMLALESPHGSRYCCRLLENAKDW
jgi:hypothetical protein